MLTKYESIYYFMIYMLKYIIFFPLIIFILTFIFAGIYAGIYNLNYLRTLREIFLFYIIQSKLKKIIIAIQKNQRASSF